jgi:phage-related minor tail protein
MTTEDRKIQIPVEVDAGPSAAGFAQVEAAAERMADGVAAVSGKASKGVDGITAGAQAGAQKFDRATSSLVQSIQRTTAQVEAGSRANSKYFEVLASQKGVDLAVLKPYLDQLDAVQAKQPAANAALQAGKPVLDNLGISAKQTAAALRGVPAQFTDIITSLQGGQAPLTVLLQQGGQLKDMFGGAGAAAKALGGYVLGLVNPYTVLAAAVGVVAYGYVTGQKEAEEFKKSLITSGNAAGTTAGQMALASAQIASFSGATKTAAAEAVAALAATGKVSGDNLVKFGATAVNANKALGTAIGETVKNFEELGRSPTAALQKLDEKYNFLTASVYSQVRALEEQGKTQEAARIAQDAYANASDGMSRQVVQNLGLVERAWNAVKKATGEVKDSIADVGRGFTPEEQLAAIRAQRAALASQTDTGFTGNSGWMAGAVKDAQAQAGTADKQLAAQEAALAGIVNQQQEAAKAAGAYNEARKQAVSLDQFLLDNKSNALRKQDEELNRTNEINAAVAQGVYTQEQGAKKLAAALGLVNQQYDTGVNLVQIQEAESARLELVKRGQIELDTARKTGFITEEDYIKANTQLELDAIAIRKQALQGELGIARSKQNTEREQAQLSAQIAQADLDANTVRLQGTDQLKIAKYKLLTAIAAVTAAEIEQYQAEKALDIVNKSRNFENQGAAIYRQVEAIQAENTLLAYQLTLGGQTQTQRQVTLEQLRIELALKQRIYNIEHDTNLDLTQKGALIAQERAKAALASDNVARKAYVDEWQRAADTVSNDITDAFVRAVDSGKSLFVELRDSVVNLFKNLVLRPIVNAIVNPIASSIVSSLGLAGASGAANAAGSGGSSLLGNVGGAASLFGAGGLTGSLAAGAGWLTGATSFTGALSAGASLIGTGTAAGIASGLGVVAGALGPIALGVAAISAIISSNRGTPTSSMGDSNATFDATGKALTRNVFGPTSWTPTPSSNSEAVVAQLEKTYLETVANLGIKAAVTNFSYSGNTGKDGKDPQFGLGGAAGSSSFVQGETKLTDDAVKLATSRALLAALEGSDIPDYLRKVFDGLTPASATQAQIDAALADAQAIASVHKALDQLPAAFDSLKAASTDTLQALVANAGGLDTFTANLRTYYDAFATAEEKRADTITSITRTLGAAGLNVSADQVANATRDQFRAIVQAASTTIAQDGGKLYAALLSVAGQFNDLVPAAADAGTAVDDLAKTMAQVAATRQAWQDKLDVLQGKTTQRAVDLQNDLAGVTDAATQAIIRQYYAQLDLKDAATAAADALKTASDAAKTAIDNARQALADARSQADTNVQNALSGVQRAVDAEKQRVTDAFNLKDAAFASSISSLGDTINSLQSLANPLRSALSTLSASSLTPDQQRAQARAMVEAALSDARAGRTVTPSDTLTGAIGTLSKVDPAAYASRAAYLGDVNKTTATLSELAGLTDDGLSIAQKQLKATQDARDAAKKAADEQLSALDNQLATAQAQVNALYSIDDSVKSVSSAIAALSAAITGRSNVGEGKTVTATAAAFLLGNSGQNGVSTYTNDQVKSLSTAEAARALLAAIYSTAFVGLNKSPTGLDPVKVAALAPQVASLADFFGKLTAEQRAALDPGTKAWAKAFGIPGFAVGINQVPADMLALLHKDERVLPAADNRELFARLRNPSPGIEGLVAELKVERAQTALLNQRVETLLATIARNTKATSRTLDDVVNGDSSINSKSVT